MELSEVFNRIWNDIKLDWLDSSASEFEANNIDPMKIKIQDIEDNVKSLDVLCQEILEEMEKLK